MTVTLGRTSFIPLISVGSTRHHLISGPELVDQDEHLGILLFSLFPQAGSTMGIVAADQIRTINGISIANPSVITTSAAHGLISGQIVDIRGSDSTPTIDGERVVTVLSSTTFSIPVNVSNGGAEAASVLINSTDMSGPLVAVSSSARDSFQFGTGSSIVLLAPLGKGLWIATHTGSSAGGGVAVLILKKSTDVYASTRFGS